MDIIVQGKGVEYVAPDEVILNINFFTKGTTYEEVLKEGVSSVQQFVDEILIPNNLEKNEMKTRNFVIREETKYNEMTRTYEKNGFSYNQIAILKFDFNKEFLAKIMVSLSKLSNPPLCRVDFGVKNEKDCKKKVLSKAYEDAKSQAEAIAMASGKELKNCAKVDFKPFTTEYVSNARFNEELAYGERASVGSAQAIVNTFTPEDIEISETLYCLWIAE